MLITGENVSKVMGKKIKDVRDSKNYTQEFVAEKVNLSTDQYRNIENGRSIGSIPTIINICNFLGLTLDDILYDLIENKEEILNRKLYKEFNKLSLKNKEIIKTLMIHMDEDN